MASTVNTHIMFDKWNQSIARHSKNPHVETEFRLGRKTSSGFDTNVGMGPFRKVLASLEKYTEWEKTEHSMSTIYYFPANKRLVVNEETDEQVGVTKTRVYVDDITLEDCQFDVRLGISTEVGFLYDGKETSNNQRDRERWSFIRKNLSIDMSIVKGQPLDKDSDDDTTYQIEFEIIKPGLVKNDVEMFHIIHKISDVLKTLGKRI